MSNEHADLRGSGKTRNALRLRSRTVLTAMEPGFSRMICLAALLRGMTFFEGTR